MVMTLGSRGREITSGSRPSSSHSKVQGSIKRSSLKTIRERKGNIEVAEMSMGPWWDHMIQDTSTGWPGSSEGHQGVDPEDSLLLDRLNQPIAKEIWKPFVDKVASPHPP